MYKKLGIIGGLGPLATAYLYERITKLTKITKEQEHIELLIHSLPSTPDRTAFILGKSKENPLPYLIKAGTTLSDWGANLIAIPCITSHYFYEPLTKEIPVPIIHLPDEIAAFAKDRGMKSVGIMATSGTIASQLLQNALSKHNISSIIPNEAIQAQVMELIYENIKQGLPPKTEHFHSIVETLKQKGAEGIVLGCTELSLIQRDDNLGEYFLDAIDILAKKSILYSGRKLSLD